MQETGIYVLKRSGYLNNYVADGSNDDLVITGLLQAIKQTRCKSPGLRRSWHDQAAYQPIARGRGARQHVWHLGLHIIYQFPRSMVGEQNGFWKTWILVQSKNQMHVGKLAISDELAKTYSEEVVMFAVGWRRTKNSGTKTLAVPKLSR